LSQKTVDNIVKNLTKKGFEVFDHYQLEDGNYAISAEKMILHYDVSSQLLTISFLVSAAPDFVGTVTLILSQIEKVKVNIAESFCYGNNDEIVTGEKAHEMYNKTVADRVVEEFVKEQSQLNMLRFGSCYKA